VTIIYLGEEGGNFLTTIITTTITFKGLYKEMYKTIESVIKSIYYINQPLWSINLLMVSP